MPTPAAVLNDDHPTPQVLVTAEELGSRQRAYLQFDDLDRKEAFREQMLSTLFGDDAKARVEFVTLCKQIETDGIAIIDRFIDRPSIDKMVDSYENMMAGEASKKSSIHHYVDLKQHPEFVFNSDYNDLFFHPVTIAALGYLNGGPVIINDARAKDAPPSNTREQDNSLHFDNKPFFDELKINISFEKGTGKGPKGQNFVTIPGVNQLFRNSEESPDGDIFSREKFSVIDSQAMVDEVLAKQQQIRGKTEICEVKGTEGPAVALFRSSRIVHQRYRTLEDESTRSGVILAFQDARYFQNLPEMPDIPEGQRDSIGGFLLAGPRERTNMDAEFLDALRAQNDRMAEKLHTLFRNANTLPDQPVLHSISDFAMDEERFAKWYADAVVVQTVSDTKAEKGVSILGQDWEDKEAFSSTLLELMALDKMANLDLRLYPDYRDEERKPQRAKARETSRDQMATLIERYLPTNYTSLEQTPKALDNDAMCGIIRGYAEKLADTEAAINSNSNAASLTQLGSDCHSLKQLFIDLEDQIKNCDTDQRKVTAGLFVFLSVASNVSQLDNKCRQAGIPPIISDQEAFETQCQSLLGNYISTVTKMEKSQSNVIPFAERYSSRAGVAGSPWTERAGRTGNENSEGRFFP